jgi:ABC-2 type transport system ATP-binding protein
MSSAEQAAVSVTGLRKSFGPREVLCGLDLAIGKGTLYGLIGPNGAGKTTLFRILVGLTRASAGSAEILGLPPGHRKARAAIGYMTQAEALYQDLSVDENLRFFGRLFGMRGAALDRAVAETLALVDLADRADTPVHELSGGMRRRASLACAVIHRPQLLLLDEPTVGVDPELRAQFWETFVEWGRRGTTLIISTHHLDEANRCHTLGLLRSGTLLAEGSPRELMADTHAETMEDAFLAFARRQG